MVCAKIKLNWKYPFGVILPLHHLNSYLLFVCFAHWSCCSTRRDTYDYCINLFRDFLLPKKIINVGFMVYLCDFKKWFWSCYIFFLVGFVILDCVWLPQDWVFALGILGLFILLGFKLYYWNYYQSNLVFSWLLSLPSLYPVICYMPWLSPHFNLIQCWSLFRFMVRWKRKLCYRLCLCVRFKGFCVVGVTSLYRNHMIRILILSWKKSRLICLEYTSLYSPDLCR